MRIACAALLAAVGLAMMAPPPADACSIRGRWCGYPLWAANAFEDPWGRVNEGSGPNVPAASYGDQRVHRPAARRYDHRRRRGR